MFKQAGIVFFYTLTPLHAGSGSSIAAVDLPIQRERPTGFPLIQASGVKGALRSVAEQQAADRAHADPKGTEHKKVEIVFGPAPEPGQAAEHGGALSLTDARLLLFPVRSARGVFAWITCPALLWRFQRDLAIVWSAENGRSDRGDRPPTPLEAPLRTIRLASGQAVTPEKSPLLLGTQLILEDLCFTVLADAEQRQAAGDLADWLAQQALPDELTYWRKKLATDLVVLCDNDCREFVELATEVITRVKLGETGTVEAGPWDEEHLPAETLLYSLALAADPRVGRNSGTRERPEGKDALPIPNAAGVLAYVRELLAARTIIQIGGDETVGRGLVRVRYLSGEPRGGGDGDRGA